VSQRGSTSLGSSLEVVHRDHLEDCVSDTAIDISDMIAAHDTLRKEYASLPLLVKSIADGDSERAAVVSDHIALMALLMTAHHDAEDALLWPLAEERAPEHEAIFIMEREHNDLTSHVALMGVLADAWRSDPSATNRAALHTELIAFEKDLLKHLGHEEREALPLLGTVITQEEFASFGARARDSVPAEQRALLLGLILADTNPASRAVVLAGMSPASRSAYEDEGKAAAQAYRARLLGMQ
jgi:hemerythrin-like domain-containing protein